MASNTVEVTDQNFDTEVLQAKIPVLVDFWAEWCGPCRVLGPTVEALAEEYAGKVKVAKLNVDENVATASRYRIQGIPTLLLFQDGEIREQLVGAQPRSVLEKAIGQYVNT